LRSQQLNGKIPISNTSGVLLGGILTAVSYTHLDVYKSQGFYPSPDGGIPWMRVAANQPLSNVTLAGSGQIDQAGAYLWPFPPWPDAVVEGTAYGTDGPDHHILILQTSTNSLYGPQTGPCTLYETYQNSDVPSLYDAGSNTWFLGASTHYNLGSRCV